MSSRSLSMLAFACIILSGCNIPSKHVSGELVQSVRSPDGLIDALITRSTGGGATVSTTFRIYLKTNDNSSNYIILQADHVFYPIVVEWQDKNHLLVNLPCANVFSYTNFLDFMKNGSLFYQVSVELQNHGLCSVYLSKEQGFTTTKWR